MTLAPVPSSNVPIVPILVLSKAGFGTSMELQFRDIEMESGPEVWWNQFLSQNGHSFAIHGPQIGRLREQCELCVSSVPNVPNVLKE